MENMLDQWWTLPPKNVVHRLKNRCKTKFSRMDQHWDWKQVCHIAENYKITISSLMVCWNKPSDDTWKLNTDGSFMKVLNKAGDGGIVRNKNGDLVMAFAYPVHFCTNNFSEAYAALIGIS
ncbi:hypothetical protein KY289_016965 [Solanum tuberosum]|nr:hypothetical protein KY284_016750 [Solanum tuberosum]KAH0689607.1 hypothetical protein KY289_016965 [Solanum tuberosum]